MGHTLEFFPLLLGALANAYLCLVCLGAARRHKRLWVALPLLSLCYGTFLLALAVGLPPIGRRLEYYYHLSFPFMVMASGVARTLAYAAIPASLLYWAVLLGKKHLARQPFDPDRRRLINAASSVLVASPLIAAGYGAFIQRTNFSVREVDVPVPGLPKDLEGLRILQLSDIHLSPFLSESELARVIDASNETRPHVAVVTGDLISTRGDPLDACLKQLSRLRSDTTTLACLGNHEGYAGVKRYVRTEGARQGIFFLVRQTRQLRFGKSIVNFAGVDYEPISMREQYLRGAEEMIVPGTLNVLLSHNPDVFPAAARKGYDVMLAGHTHGGQVNVEILDQSINPARFLTPYVYGLYQEGPFAAYVTRGIGTIGIPARFGAPPEISLLRLKKA